MVENITSLTRSGLRDWIIQRISSILIGIYTLFLLIYFLAHPQLEFTDWQVLYSHTSMRVFSLLVLLSMIYHSWIGIWTVFTDYVKPYFLRMVLQTAMVIALISYLVWGIEILWGL